MRRLLSATFGGAWLAFASFAFAQPLELASKLGSQPIESTPAINKGVPPPPGMGDDVCWPGVGDPGNSCTTDADCSVGRCGNKNAYISFTPPAGADLAIKITIVAIPQFPDRAGNVWWVKAPQSIPDSPGPPITIAEVECTTTPHKQDWGTVGLLHVFGETIIPSVTSSLVSLYEVRMCTGIGGSCSDPLAISTAKHGDIVAPFGGGSQPNLGDINGIVRTFAESLDAPSVPRADLVGTSQDEAPNQCANFVDILTGVRAFQNYTSMRPVPRACPP